MAPEARRRARRTVEVVLRAAALVVARVRGEDDVVEPQRKLDGDRIRRQVVHAIEALEAIVDVLERVVVTMRLAVVRDDVRVDRLGCERVRTRMAALPQRRKATRGGVLHGFALPAARLGSSERES